MRSQPEQENSTPDHKTSVQRSIAARDVDGLLKLLNDKDPLARSWAAWGLGQLRDRRAVDALIENLNYPDKKVIAACIRALGEIGDPRAAPKLAFRLYTNPLDRERQIEQEPAAQALVKRGAPAGDALIEVLRGKIDDMRQKAAVVIGRIGDPRAVAGLVEVLGQDAPLALRSAVVEALALIKDPSVVALLAEVLAKEAGPGKFRLWKAAAQGLQRQAWAPKNDATAAAYWFAQGDLAKCVAVGAPALERMLAILNDDATASAARCLGRPGDRHAVPALQKQPQHAQLSMHREALDWALAQLAAGK